MYPRLITSLLVIAWSAWCILLVGGCATTQHPLPATLPARIGLKLAPATLGQSLTLQQHLIVERSGHTQQLDTVLEIDPHQLNLVGLAFGQRIMTLHYNGKTLHTWRNPHLPSQVSGESVLEDIELTLWPTHAISNALPKGWNIQDNGKRRILLLNNVPIVVIDYPSGRRWGAKVILNNLRYKYRLIIQSVAI